MSHRYYNGVVTFVLTLVCQIVFAGSTCYQIGEDRNATILEEDIATLSDISCQIRDVLPNEIQQDFTVVEDSRYYIAKYFDNQNATLDTIRFNSLANQHKALLHVVRTINLSGDVKFQARLKLPIKDNFACVSEALLIIASNQVTLEMNRRTDAGPTLREKDGLVLLRKILDKAFNCCDKSKFAEKSSACVRCEYGQEPTHDNKQGFFEYCQKIEAVKFGGQFKRLTNITDIVIERNVTSSDSDIEVDISANWLSLPGYLVPESFGRIHLTDELKELQQLGGNEVKIRTRLFDHTNCGDLQSILQEWSPVLTENLSFAEASFAEEIIVVSLGGYIAVYSRIRSQSPVLNPQCEFGDSANFESHSNNKVVLPVAVIVRELLKRALMGSINVFVDVGLSVGVEKIFHQTSDTCEVNSWGAAWNRYKLQASGWQLFFSFVDGAIDNATLSIFISGLDEATAYLLNPTIVQNLSISNSFSFSIFCDKFIKGCIRHVVIGQVIHIPKYATKAVKKIRGERLSRSETDRYTKEISKLSVFFFRHREKGVKAWSALPTNLRIKVSNLESVISFENLSPGSIASIQAQFRNLAADRHQGFINALGNVANNRILSSSITLNRIPNVTEISEAANRIKQHRFDVGILENKNFGYVEGNLNGGAIRSPSTNMVSSGPAVPENQRIFKAVEVGGWDRYTDSEYKMLNRLAKDLGAVPGRQNNLNIDVSGSLKIVSERPYCASCQGVIQQFNQLFPNIEIVLIDGVR